VYSITPTSTWTSSSRKQSAVAATVYRLVRSKALNVHNRTVTIINKLGLHARAAAKFVTLAASFASDIKVARNGQEVNGKSIMGVMMLAASKGTEITLIANGNDEMDAIDGLTELIQQRFGESE